MTWYSESIPPVPQTTAAMVRAAFPKGNLYVDLRTEFGVIYDDDRDAKWDFSLWDTDGDGKADLEGVHPEGGITPSRYKKIQS